MSRRAAIVLVSAVVVLVAGVVVAVVLVTSSGSPQRPTAQTTRPVVPPRRKKKHPAARPQVLRLAPTLPQRSVTLPILMYHRIGRIGPNLAPITQRLTVTPADFAAQMRWLRQNGFHAVSQLQAFDALERGAKLPSRPIMITFDDGYRGVWANALPVLMRLQMPATAYVITDRISNGDPSFLTWRQLRALQANGVTVGSHTVTHPDLTTLDDARALAELADSRQALERRLGRPVQWFAYPAGAEDARIVSLTHRAGYVLAVTTQPGSVQSAADPLELHRYEILDSTHVTGLAQLLRAVT
jgi:peptidoglycan/xylan/chitin deacetylase (PgdA/CDA1 family)